MVRKVSKPIFYFGIKIFFNLWLFPVRIELLDIGFDQKLTSSRESGSLSTLVHRRAEEELSPREFPDVLQERVAVDDVLTQGLAQVVDGVLDGGLFGVRVQQLLEQRRRRRDGLKTKRCLDEFLSNINVACVKS